MKHEVLCLGKAKESFVTEGVSLYAGRLHHYTTFSLTVLKDRPRGALSPRQAAEAEGRSLLQAVPAGALVVALDPGGKQLSSEELANLIGDWETRGVKQVCYLIGGPDGHPPPVLARADLLLSLSRMIFTHDMARLLLIEQLYRAYTIRAGEKYHK